MNLRLRYLCFLLCLVTTIANATSEPAAVTRVLVKAGKNRPELEKAISYCRRSGDEQKLKAVYFLISNMDIHLSANYYWADGNNKKVDFNELGYPNYYMAGSALRMITLKTPGLHAVVTQVSDIEVIKGDFLINNINLALKAWRSSKWKNIPFGDFCEYILPYRISVEPLQDWRLKFQQKYLSLKTNVDDGDIYKALGQLATDSKAWFASTYGATEKREPLPRLGALQLLFRKQGLCQDMADLQVFALRSQGIPVSLDIVPYWATSTGSHFTNTVFTPKMSAIQYDAAIPAPLINKSLNSEPSKVLRTTYARQKGTLASIIDEKNIPDGFLRTQNYVDITDQYWETQTVSCDLFNNDPVSGIVYACVFNGMKWRPTWWGRSEHGTVTFNKMTKGVVYLPQTYVNGQLKAAGYPVAIGYHHQQELIPEMNKRHGIVIKQEAKYLAFQPGKKYKLFFWNRNWVQLTEATAGYGTTTMFFRNVPDNALLLLVPEYSKKKERPFIITENGQTNWF